MKKLNEKYFCIYGGGSIRGLAYAGAIKAMDELGIQRVGYAGSSVGALMAIFDVFGYSYEEIKEEIINVNFELFKDINFSFGWDIAISKGEIFYNWVKEIIEKKYYGEHYQKGENNPVCFKDLDKDLIIITSNFENASFKEFSRYTEPDFEIAKAVRISAAMPGLMKSVNVDGEVLIDGDLLKPAPLWSLSDSMCPDNARVLEYRLEGENKESEIKNTIDFLNALISNISKFATEYIVKRYLNKDKFDYIVLTTKDVSLVNFNISKEKREELIQMGYQNTYNYFTDFLVQKKSNLLKDYKILYEYIIKIKKSIEHNKLRVAKNLVGELFICLADIEKYIDLNYYDLIIDFKNMFTKNLSQNMLGIYKLENKEFINAQLQYLGSTIWHNIKEMEEYKAIIGEKNAEHKEV